MDCSAKSWEILRPSPWPLTFPATLKLSPSIKVPFNIKSTPATLNIPVSSRYRLAIVSPERWSIISIRPLAASVTTTSKDRGRPTRAGTSSRSNCADKRRVPPPVRMTINSSLGRLRSEMCSDTKLSAAASMPMALWSVVEIRNPFSSTVSWFGVTDRPSAVAFALGNIRKSSARLAPVRVSWS